VALFFTDSLPFLTGGEDAIYNRAPEIPAALLNSVQAIADIRPQNFAVETTDGIDLDLNYRGRLLGGDLALHMTGQYILNLSLAAPGGTAVSRLDGYAQPSNLRLNGTIVWGRGGISGGTVVSYVNGFTDNRPGQTPSRIGSYTTATAFLGLDLGRLSSAFALKNSEVQIVVANVFNQRPPRITDAVLGFDPYNNPPNPRTVGVMLTKSLG
jgi:iron complex outermembrane receptor protein